ncbi:hypothetical protein [Halobacillus sp. BBL2006]|uniref:hypothetical protein n=1 Tax=Halobacillus sp. BBL2006 TaxID=1543706 RepID=UPI0005444B6F|nr:hypothetical protein [Halobacillus sp. BBL2006]KHE73097.1 hypothetical protein LD39_01140 [Halobacillus sp. BBL2006]
MKKVEQDRIVHQVVEEIYADYPFLWEKFGQNGRDRTEEDNYHHLDHLYAAYEMNSSDFFIDYTNWLNNVLTSRGVGTHLIVDNFERLQRLLQETTLADEDEHKAMLQYLHEALIHLPTLSK